MRKRIDRKTAGEVAEEIINFVKKNEEQIAVLAPIQIERESAKKQIIRNKTIRIREAAGE